MSKARHSTVKEGGKILLVLLVNMSDSRLSYSFGRIVQDETNLQVGAHGNLGH